MSITISGKTKAKASLKLYNFINSYLFEQECSELNGYPEVKDSLIKAKQSLYKIITNNK